MLKEWIEEKYENSVRINNISLPGNTSYAGYASLTMDEVEEPDWIILMYGQNDTDEEISKYYEALVRICISKYPKACIVGTLQSSQKDYTHKIQEIKKILQHYGIGCIDTIEGFSEAGIKYTHLEVDGIHPNDLGQYIYYRCFRDFVLKEIEKENVIVSNREISPLYKDALDYESFHFYSASQFERVDDYTWKIDNICDYGSMGLYRLDFEGDSSVEVYCDGLLVDKVQLSGVSQWKFTEIIDSFDVSNQLSIKFSRWEEAENFKGIVVSHR